MASEQPEPRGLLLPERGSTCKCRGFHFFWAWEIEGWKGKPHDRVRCLDCENPGWLERWYYRSKGYTSNNQIK